MYKTHTYDEPQKKSQGFSELENSEVYNDNYEDPIYENSSKNVKQKEQEELDINVKEKDEPILTMVYYRYNGDDSHSILQTDLNIKIIKNDDGTRTQISTTVTVELEIKKIMLPNHKPDTEEKTTESTTTNILTQKLELVDDPEAYSDPIELWKTIDSKSTHSSKEVETEPSEEFSIAAKETRFYIGTHNFGENYWTDEKAFNKLCQKVGSVATATGFGLWALSGALKGAKFITKWGTRMTVIGGVVLFLDIAEQEYRKRMGANGGNIGIPIYMKSGY